MYWVQSKIAVDIGVNRTTVSGNFGLNPTFQNLRARDQTKNIAGVFATAEVVSIFLL